VFDGDKLLVCNHPTLIKAAERNNHDKKVVPLFYFMDKAKAEQITPESLFKGLSLAFTGGNIGTPSNNITKIWNSGDISDEAIMAVKWLVMQTNHIIDYAKTLYKPIVPQYADDIIKRYVHDKVPYFFIYAKKKSEQQVEPTNSSTVNRIREIFPKRNISFNFSNTTLGKFDYRVLLKNPAAVGNDEVYKFYKRLVGRLDFNSSDDRLADGDKSMYNYSAVYDNCKYKFYQWGYEHGIEPSDLLDSLIVQLFTKNKTPRKKAFWVLFGDEIYENIRNNISTSFVMCERCRKRFLRIKDDCLCEKCVKQLKRKKMKTYTCCDCGQVFDVTKKSRTPKRCPECAKKQIANSKNIWRIVNED
jgi:hypothetical protein